MFDAIEPDMKAWRKQRLAHAESNLAEAQFLATLQVGGRDFRKYARDQLAAATEEVLRERAALEAEA